jgi:hypothetical protein
MVDGTAGGRENVAARHRANAAGREAQSVAGGGTSGGEVGARHRVLCQSTTHARAASPSPALPHFMPISRA